MLKDEELEKKKEEAIKRREMEALKPINYDEYIAVMNKWLLLPDQGILKLIPAAIIANKLPWKPLWLFLKGASGGGKTAILDAFCDWPDIFVISNLTPNTLLSGMVGKDASLLPIVNNKILLFRDFTNIASQSREARNEIMGQFRDAYDGDLRRPVGTGKILRWGPGGKIGIIAGTTEAIDMQLRIHATLGERFLHYRIVTPDRKTVAEQCLKNAPFTKQMEKELKNAAYSFMKGIKIPEKNIEIPEEARKELVKIANFVSLARSGIFREEGTRKDILFVPAPEMPTRIVQNLELLLTALIIISGNKISDDLLKIVYKTAIDSIPGTNRMVLIAMTKQDNMMTKDIAMKLNYPTPTIRTYLENLSVHQVCSRKKGSDTEEGGAGDRWIINPEFGEIILEHEGLTKEPPDVVFGSTEKYDSEKDEREIFDKNK